MNYKKNNLDDFAKKSTDFKLTGEIFTVEDITDLKFPILGDVVNVSIKKQSLFIHEYIFKIYFTNSIKDFWKRKGSTPISLSSYIIEFTIDETLGSVFNDEYIKKRYKNIIQEALSLSKLNQFLVSNDKIENKRNNISFQEKLVSSPYWGYNEDKGYVGGSVKKHLIELGYTEDEIKAIYKKAY